MAQETPHKKRRLNPPPVFTSASIGSATHANADTTSGSFPDHMMEVATDPDTGKTDVPLLLASLNRSVSPPTKKSKAASFNKDEEGRTAFHDESDNKTSHPGKQAVLIPKASPIQLTRIRDLDASKNIDTIGLSEILGDPLIRECWQFNYLFDVDFLMAQFDDDVRELVKVKVVHGSWKKDSTNKIRIDEAVKRYPNVQAITAYMPEPFGTHHSKMMILFRHDDFAQVIIHTANIIPQDWGNMCQAVWRSPLLPLISPSEVESTASTANSPSLPPIGSGPRFKKDLLAYLFSYGQKKLGALTKELRLYEFRSVRAALVASTPSKSNLGSTDSKAEHLWGWPGLKEVLRAIPTEQSHESESEKPHVVIQISSIASLGQTDKWLKETFLDTLATTSRSKSNSKSKPTPKFSIIFPTADEIRRSLDGYTSGGSIHMKTQSAAQAKQVAYMKPMLCHWAGDADRVLATTIERAPVREAGRRRAAPHIKTYIRFSDDTMTKIDWAMVTSANLSTQAWGSAVAVSGEVKVCSYEIGVMVWPELFAEEEGMQVEMVPVFKKDLPTAKQALESGVNILDRPFPVTKVVGFRMPYDLPLSQYVVADAPWCATAPCAEPDWMGRTWPGF